MTNNFFDLPEEKQKKILNKAARESARMQELVMKQNNQTPSDRLDEILLNMKLNLSELKYWQWTRRKEKLAVKIAHMLPKWLVYRAAIRLMAHATVGKYSSQVVPELTVEEALKRWKK